MTTQPEPKSNVVQETIDFLYSQFHGAPVIEAIVSAWAVQSQEIEDLFVDLIVLFALPNATGDQLDILGQTVGEERLGRSDDDYRVAIGARIKMNKSNGSVEDIYEVLKAAEDREYDIDDLGQAYFQVRAVDAMTDALAAVLDAILQHIRGAGIRADFHYSNYDDDSTFTLASGDTTESSTSTGLGYGYIGDVV